MGQYAQLYCPIDYKGKNAMHKNEEQEYQTVIRLTRSDRHMLRKQELFENRSMNRIVQSAIKEYCKKHRGKWDEFSSCFERDKY
jgi:hypothetical protein